MIHQVLAKPQQRSPPAAVDASINLVYLPINRESTRIKVFSRFIKGLLSAA